VLNNNMRDDRPPSPQPSLGYKKYFEFECFQINYLNTTVSHKIRQPLLYYGSDDLKIYYIILLSCMKYDST
jgi:hypothetical protein